MGKKKGELVASDTRSFIGTARFSLGNKKARARVMLELKKSYSRSNVRIVSTKI